MHRRLSWPRILAGRRRSSLMATTHTDPHEHVRTLIEREIERVDSPEAAEEVVRVAERLASGKTEVEAGEQAAQSGSASAAIQETAAATSGKQEVASVLVETAAQSVAPKAESGQVLEAAQQVLGGQAEPRSPRVQRSRRLLQDALFRRMGPFQAFDARVYLTINDMPHPNWANRAANVITVATEGGWIYVIGVLLAYVRGAHGSWDALKAILPSLTIATFIVEFPVKTFFRRRRPFIDVVRAMVIGKKPGSWSFPSGHAASSFAAALILSTAWPRKTPLFYSIASLVGFSRIYVGAHYPGDVLTGAVVGTFLSETIRRIARRIIG